MTRLYCWCVAVAMLVAFSGCDEDGQRKADKWMRVTTKDGYYTRVHVLTIDGQTYLVNYEGGIIKHEPK